MNLKHFIKEKYHLNDKQIITDDKDNIIEVILYNNKLYDELNNDLKAYGYGIIPKITYHDEDGTFWEEITYDDNGNQLTFKSSDGYWNESTYDKNGNQLTCRISNGYWWKKTYDENGNQLTYKNSYGYWEEKTYDDNGNQLTFKSSRGYWWEKTYDENGNVIDKKTGKDTNA